MKDQGTSGTEQGLRNAAKWFAPAMAVLTVASLAVPSAVRAQTAITFNTVIKTYTQSSYNFPGSVATGDFNGDGKLDALISDGSSSLRLLLGNGDGTFVEHDINVAGANPGSIRAADLNGDGKLDVVFVSNGGNQDATVLLNTGNDSNGIPQFSTATYAPGFGQLRSVTVGDLNGDGRPDFIVGGAYAQLRVYMNNGDGTFTQGQEYLIDPSAGGPAVGLGAIADLNGDGAADFIVTSTQNRSTDIFYGYGDGTFKDPVVLSTPAATSIAVADLNSDGKPDFVEGDSDGTLAVYLNNGAGTFSAPAYYATAPNSYSASVVLADLNGDGKLDAIVGNYWNLAINDPLNTVAVLQGKGDGSFGPASLFTTDWGVLDVHVGDFNGDGKTDVAAIGRQNRTFDVLLNTTVTVPPLEFDSLSVSPSVLWPANHKLVPVTLTPAFSGGLEPISWHIASVTSNEPANGVGDGNTSSDWVIGADGHSLQLRAERSGTGTGRVYTITVVGSDSSSPAQKVTKTVTVTVPHDQGK